MNKKKKLYIAGSWKDRRDVKALMIEMTHLGYKVMVDWTSHKGGATARYCEKDIKGVQECDVFVMLNSGKTSAGKYVEMGIAIDRCIPIIIVGKKLTTVFKHRVTRYIKASINSTFSMAAKLVDYLEGLGIFEGDEDEN
jgi:nucleoside 2-deoxyribosyltransferase